MSFVNLNSTNWHSINAFFDERSGIIFNHGDIGDYHTVSGLLEKADFSDEKVQISFMSKLPNFFAFFEKRNSVSSFYFPIDLLLITVDDIINKTLKISKVNSCLTA